MRACVLLPCAVASSQTELAQLEQDAMYAAASEAARYVVRVETIGGAEKIGEQLISSAPTSGIVVAADGYIACSAYAFANEPTSILVGLPGGKRQAAQVVSRDFRYGLVLLKVTVDEPLPVPRPADSQDIPVGAWALTVARTVPGEGFNMSVGIVSAKRRIWGKAIQVDANVSPSNYGGALVTIDGSVVGILVPMSPNSDDVMAGTEWYDSGIGFAVPLDRVLEQLDRWKAHDLHSGKMGIAMASETLYGAAPVIGVCRPKSPAREAGLQKGDKIVALDEVPVANYAQLRHLLGPKVAGDRIRLSFQRDGERKQASLELTDKLELYEHAFLGVLPGPVEDEQPGVLVRYVYPNSPAGEAGIQAGDRLTQLNDEVVESETAFRQLLAALEPQQAATIELERADVDEKQTITVTLASDIGEVPESLPPRFDDEVASSSEDLPPLGKIDIKLPEEVNDCVAYIPESYRVGREHGLIVYLPAPGEDDIAGVVRHWRDACNRTQSILLVPQSRDERRWESSETQFVRKTIDNLRKDYEIDRDRVVVLGESNSGAMAYLVAFHNRELIRGVATIDAVIPRSSPPLFNEPLQRLSFWIMSSKEGRVADRVEGNVKLLRRLKFPVTHGKLESTDLDDPLRGTLLRWHDTLDRL